MTTTLIHLDDEIQILDLYAAAFVSWSSTMHLNIKSFSTISEFESELTVHKNVDIFIIDLCLGKSCEDGLALISHCRALFPFSLILISSNAKDHHLIHSSLKLGADDFIPKDIDTEGLVRLVDNKFQSHRMTLHLPKKHGTIAGSFMEKMSQRIPQIISSAINCVHLFGETGTGKEIIADIFENCMSSNTPFVRVNCGAIAPSLVVSEMFGHVKGAFTGAICEKKGLIEAANNGWIFLDEIATLPSDAQAALLRAIDNQKIRRIGATRDFTVNFRVLSATNEPLEDLVAAGRFRKDLWQRLRETEIALPPLRERKSEISEFINYFCQTMRGGPYALAPTVMDILNNYDWREGNIRELRNCLRSMTEKAVHQILTPNCIPDRVWCSALGRSVSPMPTNSKNGPSTMPRIELTWQETSRPDFEKLSAILFMELIRAEHAIHGKVSMRSLARALGIPKSTLPSKIQSIVDYGLAKKHELHDLISSRPGCVT